jgi:hypothetical protein
VNRRGNGVVHLLEVFDQPRPGGLPAKPRAGDCTGRGKVETGKHPKPAEMRRCHPEIGLIELEFSTFAVEGRPDLNMMVFTPATSDGAERIRSLIAKRAGQEPD